MVSRPVRRFLGYLVIFVFLVGAVRAEGTGACVKQPDPKAPTEGDQFSMRIANGLSYAQDAGESPGRPGRYFYDAIRECRPKDFVAIYDNEGNAHLSFVVKDKKRAGLPLKGANRNHCDLGGLIGSATHGDYTPQCVFGDSTRLANEWAKSKATKKDDE